MGILTPQKERKNGSKHKTYHRSRTLRWRIVGFRSGRMLWTNTFVLWMQSKHLMNEAFASTDKQTGKHWTKRLPALNKALASTGQGNGKTLTWHFRQQGCIDAHFKKNIQDKNDKIYLLKSSSPFTENVSNYILVSFLVFKLFYGSKIMWATSF